MKIKHSPTVAGDGIATLASLSTDDLYCRLSAANAERAAIREILRVRRAREREAQKQEEQRRITAEEVHS